MRNSMASMRFMHHQHAVAAAFGLAAWRFNAARRS
jgi:hypothetical protein